MTASAVCSLSLDPPLLLVCIDRRSATLDAIRAHGRFVVNALAADQAETSAVFAGRTDQAARFARCAHRRLHGLPVLEGSVAWLTCQVHDLLSGGDHEIVVGQVVAHDRAPAEPLVWHAGTYRRLDTAA